jgi:hypothetical protein
MCVELAYLYDSAIRHDVPARWAEVRHRQDGLGLTPTGKRTLRLRLAENPSEILANDRLLTEYRERLDRMGDDEPPSARFAGLMLIDDEKAVN